MPATLTLSSNSNVAQKLKLLDCALQQASQTVGLHIAQAGEEWLVRHERFLAFSREQVFLHREACHTVPRREPTVCLEPRRRPDREDLTLMSSIL